MSAKPATELNQDRFRQRRCRMLLELLDHARGQPMPGRQIDGFEKINRLCHSPADFADASCANGSPGTCQNQEQLRGGSPIGTFARIYQVTDRSSERGPAGLQYLAVSCRLEENIKCNHHRIVFSRRPSKARSGSRDGQPLWRIESICLAPAADERSLT